jgi:hypothetical protein
MSRLRNAILASGLAICLASPVLANMTAETAAPKPSANYCHIPTSVASSEGRRCAGTENAIRSSENAVISNTGLATMPIDAHGTCRYVDNYWGINLAAGETECSVISPSCKRRSFFVPLRSAVEWSSFVNAQIEGLALAPCARPEKHDVARGPNDAIVRLELGYARAHHEYFAAASVKDENGTIEFRAKFIAMNSDFAPAGHTWQLAALDYRRGTEDFTPVPACAEGTEPSGYCRTEKLVGPAPPPVAYSSF